MRRVAVVLGLTLTLTGCLGAPLSPGAVTDAPEPTPTFAPISLIVTPTPFWSTAPLPLAEAAQVFKYPDNGKPSLLFIYDDSAT